MIETKLTDNPILRALSADAQWSVVTALRGPDNDDEQTKFATTGIVRRALLGVGFVGFDYNTDNNIVIGQGGCLYPNADTEDYVEKRRSLPTSHFRIHAELAFDALGLSWDSVNQFDSFDRQRTPAVAEPDNGSDNGSWPLHGIGG